jgi:hypothetical protein
VQSAGFASHSLPQEGEGWAKGAERLFPFVDCFKVLFMNLIEFLPCES